MKKDFTRDYVTEAFRFYAAMGKPSYTAAKERIYQAELMRWKETDPADAILRAERAVVQNTPLLLDLLAAGRTMELLKRGGRYEIARAVEEVYFADPCAPLRAGDISARVRRFARLCPASERTVYLWLRDARELCAALRGLRQCPEAPEGSPKD